MRCIFKPGEKKLHSFKVKDGDLAAFNDVVVHNVCSTFALAREIEWASRLFVLDAIESDEEGIGTRLEIVHKRPAFLGELVQIAAVVKSFRGNELLCTYSAFVEDKLIAEGITGQKILKSSRIEELILNR